VVAAQPFRHGQRVGRVSSKVGVMKARVWPSNRSTRWISASTSSTGDHARRDLAR
jgi:hypothetical protein